MIKLEKTEVMNWETAIRGMRNPKNSWEKSDSKVEEIYGLGYKFVIGPNDHKLMMNLAKAGTDHAKYRRQIIVSVDITAPLYWWKEFDTYKVGTVANSCSTMHKIHAKEFELDDFSHERLICVDDPVDGYVWEEHTPMGALLGTIGILNECRRQYVRTKNKRYWETMIQLLPSSYNQKRTVTMNYENLANMYKSRKNHKLDEWHVLCDWIKSLPYSEIITLEEES